MNPQKANKEVPLYWGAHIANDRGWTKQEDDDDVEVSPKMKDDHVDRKNNNAKFEGVILRATKAIRPRQEICVSYNYTKSVSNKSNK